MPQITLQQAFDLALRHHHAGRLHEAENLYRQILAHQPDNADVIHLLGIIANQQGRNDAAVDLIRRALVLRPDFADAHGSLGNALSAMGNIDEAVAAYQQCIALRPGDARAQFNLGLALKRGHRHDAAIDAFRQAVAVKADYAEAYGELGHALVARGRRDEAIVAYRCASSIKPDAVILNNLGSLLKDRGDLDEAIAACRQAVGIDPTIPEAHMTLGNCLAAMGELDQAIVEFRQAIALRENFPQAHFNLGNALAERSEIDDAVTAYQRALSMNPHAPQVYNNLGNALKNSGRIDEAIAAYQQLIALQPALADASGNVGAALQSNQALVIERQAQAYSNLGNALADKSEIDQALAAYQRAIALNPKLPQVYNNLGNALKNSGRIDEAIDAYQQAIALKPTLADAYGNLGVALQPDQAIVILRQALALDPSNALFHSNFVYTLYFNPRSDARAISEEQRRWNQLHAESLAKFIRPHLNDPDPNRPLHVGYVSPDFRDHVVGHNLLPLFSRHDRKQYHITCYSNVMSVDQTTRRFEQLSDRWRKITGLSDEKVDRQIRDDGIDILVDLTLHMNRNRLPIFARKPAPVQATFAGYPGSTGLTAIDYRLSDPYLDPPGMDESIYSEKTIRLPASFWCYDPLDCADISVNGLPAAQAGCITFGCLNNFAKVNDDLLAIWSNVLRQVAGSRLLMLAAKGSQQSRVRERLKREGIDPARVEFVTHQPRRQYLQSYSRIDIGLDTFPYNGHTTSLDSLWMGVPVVTLVGDTAVARAGWCQLSNLGLGELAGRTPEEFVSIAVRLASDLPRLAQLRSTLRSRMERCPLMDAPRFAASIEAAYRQMWQTWCAAQAAGAQSASRVTHPGQ